MKKIVLSIFLAISTFVFAEPNREYVAMFEKFFKSGFYIKKIREPDGIYIVPRSSIVNVHVSETKIIIMSVGVGMIPIGGKDVYSKDFFEIEEWDFSSDEENNIIIKRIEKLKKKK